MRPCFLFRLLPWGRKRRRRALMIFNIRAWSKLA
jgi:hypothetical protein